MIHGGRIEERADPHLVGEYGQVAGCRADDPGRLVLGPCDHELAGRELRRGHRDTVEAGQSIGVIDGQGRGRADGSSGRPGPGEAGTDCQQVRAQRLQLIADARRRALSDADEGHNRCHTDDDAEHGQSRP